MKKTIAILAACAMQLAYADGDRYVVMGAGAADSSCGDWLSFRRNAQKPMANFVVSWSQGYLSGLNMAQDQSKWITMPASSVIEAVLDKDCAADPTTSVAVVSTALFWNLYAKRNKR
jgi:hypothetical protein